ncbi:hypothetical protein ACROYT_G022079 [Oculina patagonica]
MDNRGDERMANQYVFALQLCHSFTGREVFSGSPVCSTPLGIGDQASKEATGLLCKAMPSRVTPNEASVLGEPEMRSSTSVQPTSNDVPIIDDSTSDHGHFNGQPHKTIDEIYSPVLKLMKLFGINFGDTS